MWEVMYIKAHDHNQGQNGNLSIINYFDFESWSFRQIETLVFSNSSGHFFKRASYNLQKKSNKMIAIILNSNRKKKVKRGLIKWQQKCLNMSWC